MRLVRQRHFTATLSPEKIPGAHCKGCWMGVMDVLDGHEADTVLCSHQGSNSESSNLWRFTLPITLSRLNRYQSGIILIWYIDMIYWYDILIWYIDMIYWYDILMIYWYDILIWYIDVIYWYDILVWYIDMIYWYDISIWHIDMIYWYDILIWYIDMIYLLTAMGLPPGGSSAVHI